MTQTLSRPEDFATTSLSHAPKGEPSGSKSLSLVTKLARISSEMKHVPKNGFNKNGNYPYATDGDVFNAVNKACEQYDVFMSWDNKLDTVQITEFKTSTGTTWMRYRFDATLTFMDGDSDSIIVTNWPCIANDQADKGFGKAQTLGLKYALKTTFRIDTGDRDPDGEPQPDNAPAQRQGKPHNNNQRPHNNQRPAQQQQQQQQRPAAQQNAPATPPPDMGGRSIAALEKPLQKAVMSVYRLLGVEAKTAALGAHLMAITAVCNDIGGRDKAPEWWDGFEVTELEAWIGKRTDAANRARKEKKIQDILRLTGWSGKEQYTPDDIDRSLIRAAAALQINLEDAPVSWSGYNEAQIDQVLAKLHGNA